ncbi:MAG TPA: TIGR03790 family protein, partial [Verrucomicrobiae bacterium]
MKSNEQAGCEVEFWLRSVIGWWFVRISAFLALPIVVVADGGPQNVLLVVNGQSQASLEVANEYQRLRNLPEQNVFYLAGSNTAALYSGGDLRRLFTGGSYRTNVLWPALSYIRAHGLTNQIDFIAYSADIPTQVDVRTEPGVSNGILGTAFFSLTSMTAFADLVEPLNSSSNLAGNVMQSFRGFTFASNSSSTFTTNITHGAVWATNPVRRYYMSTVLGWTHWFGNTTDELKACLQRSRAADATHPTGTVYLDANADVRGLTRSSQFGSTSNELATLGIASFILTNNPSPYSITNKPDILGAVMGAAAPYVPAGSYYLPGSIAESLTSFSGILDNTGIGQFRMTQHLGVGVAGTSGTITEPFAVSGKFPAARMHAHYARGVTLGEAFYLSVQQPYHLLIMGDPLCRPHATIPATTLAGLADGEIISGSRTLLPSASTLASNGIAGFDLFLDGVLWQAVAVGGSNTLDSTTLADGWHELCVVAYENSAIRTQGDLVLSFRTDNAGQQVVPAASNFTATVGGANLSVPVAAVGGSPSQIEVRKGDRVVATIAGASGTASIALTNLGPGQSILRAVATMSSGLVHSARIVVDVNRPPDVTPPVAARYYVQMGTNNTLGGLRSKPAYKNSDWMYFNVVPSEPVGLTNIVVKVGGGTVQPFPIRWTGLSSTNILPNLAGLTNPIIQRYQLSESRDIEGQLPVELTLRDGAGLTTVTTNFITTDYTPPAVTQAWVVPQIAAPGTTAKLHFLVNELLASNPVVSVRSNPATLSGITSNRYTFDYVVSAGDPVGTNAVAIDSLLDLAENQFITVNDTDDFEGKTLGSNLTNDTRWRAATSSGTSLTVVITNNPVAPGSTRSAYFRDVTGSTNQIYSFNFPTRRQSATVEFDVYINDRNPSGNADFRVRPSVGTTSRREVELVLNQADTISWRAG